MATKKTPYDDQAAALALTRYGPEASALAALLRDAQANRDKAILQAKTGRQFTVGAVDQALPRVQQAYQGAAQAVTPAFAGGGGIEASALTARMGEASALAKTQLANRRVGAIEGESAARTQALRDYASDSGKIGARYADLGRESGAFTASTIQELLGADAAAKAKADADAADRTQSQTNALIGAGVDPVTGKPLPGHGTNRKPNGGKGWATTEQQSAAADEIGRLLKEAQENAAAGENRADTADLLMGGIPKGSRPVFKTVEIRNAAGKVTGHKQVRVLNPDGTQKTMDDPGVDPAKSQLLLQAALDMAYDKHLSRRTQSLLHKRGIQLKPLGLVTFNEWLKTPEGQEWQRKQRTGSTVTTPPLVSDGHGGSRRT